MSFNSRAALSHPPPMVLAPVQVTLASARPTRMSVTPLGGRVDGGITAK